MKNNRKNRALLKIKCKNLMRKLNNHPMIIDWLKDYIPQNIEKIAGNLEVMLKMSGYKNCSVMADPEFGCNNLWHVISKEPVISYHFKNLPLNPK